MQYDPNAVANANITCVTCGYDLSGSPIGGVCPECGTPVQESLRVSPTNYSGNVSGTAITCMVLGICGIVVCGFVSPFAIWLYYKTRDEVQAGQADPSSMGMAKAGLICGWIGLVLTFFYCGCFGLGFVAGV